jgi:peptidoglycan hydrolase CwlO-like protein
MKQGFLTIIVFIMVSSMVYAQTASRPTTSEIRQDAQQYLQEVRTNSSQFEAKLGDQLSRNIDNRDMDTLNRLRAEIEQLAASISADQNRIDADLSAGKRANLVTIRRVQQLLEQYKAKMAELEAFIARIGES